MPLARRMTKSVRVALSKTTVPRTRSSTTVSPSSGSRNRTAGLGPPAALVQLLVGAVAEVGVALGEQGVDRGVVAVQALGLHVRPVGAALEVALVPVQAQPAQPVHDPGGAVGHVALGVGVLDAQHELAAVAPREQVGVKGGPRSADMQEAGWRRGKPGANGLAHARNATRVRLDAVLSGKVGAPQLHRSALGTAVPPTVRRPVCPHPRMLQNICASLSSRPPGSRSRPAAMAASRPWSTGWSRAWWSAATRSR